MIVWSQLGRNRQQVSATGSFYAWVRKGILTVLGIGKGRMVATDAVPYMAALDATPHMVAADATPYMTAQEED